MVLGWRRRKTGHRAAKEKAGAGNLDLELLIPNHFLCPISLDLMKDPVTLSSGITYDRQSIETWLEAGNFTCPVTNQVLRNFDRIPNRTLTRMIQEWCTDNQHYGIERIPTPRIPIMPLEVSEILFSVAASARRLDQPGCLECVHKIKKLGAESEHNKRCLLENGTASVLAAAFDSFASHCLKRNVNVCEEILSALSWMFPSGLDEEAQKFLGSRASLHCMVWFLKSGSDLSAKQNSILALKELLGCDPKHVEALAEIGGVNQILFEFIRNKISPTITKASLMVIFYLVSSSSSSCEKIKSAFLEMGLVSILVETLVDSERGISERALRVLDSLCDCKEGREKAYANALTIPVLVKKILRVSEMATEHSISAIWKLCKCASRHEEEEEEEEERVLVEALQVGTFQKLLLVLQVCCGDDHTKEKTTELLKLLNPYRAGLECIESVDFKSIRRSY